MTIKTHNDILNEDLLRLGCLAAEPSPETIRLERWCCIGSDVMLGFAIGFLIIAVLTW